MRFLPWLIVTFMAAPFVIWYIIDQTVLGGAATKFTSEDMVSWYFFAPFFVIVFVALGVWMSKAVEKTLKH